MRSLRVLVVQLQILMVKLKSLLLINNSSYDITLYGVVSLTIPSGGTRSDYIDEPRYINNIEYEPGYPTVSVRQSGYAWTFF
jgi:hypothetical protein